MLQLSKEEQLTLYNLSRYPEFWVLKRILQDWERATDSVGDIDLETSREQVAGKHSTLKAIRALLADLSVIDKPKEPKINTHE